MPKSIRLEGEQVLCRFMLTNFVRHGFNQIYDIIVEQARRLHMAGATVLRGCMGYFGEGKLLQENAYALSNEVPIIVEVVDAADRIRILLDAIAPIFHRGIITVERAHVLYYRSQRGTVRLDTPEIPEPAEGRPMITPGEGVLLRIFIGDSDVHPETGQPLAYSLVTAAREMHLSGATVLRGTLGYGKHSIVHAARLLEMSRDMPMVVEIVDTEENIEKFLPYVDRAVAEGLVTMEKVRIIKYDAPPAR
ncbi:MAG: DUF190 domain-containing protein [Candidatus Xenobia bacterium]